MGLPARGGDPSPCQVSEGISLDDSNPQIDYQGNWSHTTSNHAFQGSISYTQTGGATAQIPFSGVYPSCIRLL